MHYIGVDMIEISRVEKAIARWGGSLLHRIYTDPELSLCNNHPWSLAARFAAKEAVIKALGKQYEGINWKEIEILSDPKGKPLVRLYGKAKKQADIFGLDGFAISLTHSREYAIAFVAGEKNNS